MSNRLIAGRILENARTHVTKTRGPQHGELEPSFRMIAEMWSTWINHAAFRATGIDTSPPIHLSAYDVLQMMSMLKKARALYGDGTLAEHYEDDAGYTSLAGILGGVSENEAPIPAFLQGADRAAKDMADQLSAKSRKLKEDMSIGGRLAADTATPVEETTDDRDPREGSEA